MRPVLTLFAAAAALLVSPMAAAQQGVQPSAAERPVPPLALTGRVVDDAQIIDTKQEQAMTQVLARLEQDIGVQFVVVSTSDLRGMPIEQYSLALGNGWALGDPQRGDGLLLVVAPGARQARIQVGTGLKPILTDEFVAQIIQLMLPSFREGHYADGLLIGVVSLEARLRKVAGKLPT